MVTGPSKANVTLNSWKEIATFLGRGVRTVQRWERELELPVRRVRRSEHSPVFAYAWELEDWLKSRPAPGGAGSDGRFHHPTQAGHVRLRHSEIHGVSEQTVQRSQHLVQRLGSLLIEQRSSAEMLVQTLEATRTGINELRQRRLNQYADHIPINGV